MNFEPHEYQQTAIDFILSHKSAALLLDMGLGKTVITLTALKQLLDAGEAEHILVAAPPAARCAAGRTRKKRCR